MPSRLQAAPSGASSRRTRSSLKVMLPSSITKQGMPMLPRAFTGSKAGCVSRSWRKALRLRDCSPMSMSWKRGSSLSCAFTCAQSGQEAIT